MYVREVRQDLSDYKLSVYIFKESRISWIEIFKKKSLLARETPNRCVVVFLLFPGTAGIRRKCPVRILSEWNSEDVPRERFTEMSLRSDRIHRVRIRAPRNADIHIRLIGIFGAFRHSRVPYAVLYGCLEMPIEQFDIN